MPFPQLQSMIEYPCLYYPGVVGCSMEEFPLFPLHTVLFPGMPLRLHIFEERYKRMISLCLERQQPFGVVLIRRGVEALGPVAEPFPIGCTARIVQVRRLDDGRMNIVAVGEERFRILSLDKEALPYLVSNIELFPLANQYTDEVRQASQRLRTWLLRYVRLLIEAGKGQFDPRELPNKPASLAYLAATLLQMPSHKKQQLLVIEEALDLVNTLLVAYRREVALLKVLMDEKERESGSFSIN
jgi:Lon protease-like protein